MSTFGATLQTLIRHRVDAVTLVLSPESPIAYRAGQYVTLDPHQFAALAPRIAEFEAAKGKRELVRSYSLASAPHEANLRITVQQESHPEGEPYPPLLSPHLVNGVKQGERFELGGPLGDFCIDPALDSELPEVLHVCAGSGVVPHVGLIASDLLRATGRRHTLLFFHRTFDDGLHTAELEALADAHPGRFTLRHVLTREPDATKRGPRFLHGRLGEALLREQLPRLDATELFVCGPAITLHQRKAAMAKGEKPAPRFLETAVAQLKALGVRRGRLHQEAYG